MHNNLIASIRSLTILESFSMRSHVGFRQRQACFRYTSGQSHHALTTEWGVSELCRGRSTKTHVHGVVLNFSAFLLSFTYKRHIVFSKGMRLMGLSGHLSISDPTITCSKGSYLHNYQQAPF